MRYLIQRLGFQLTRGWSMLLLLIGALIAAAFWIGPLRPLPPDLRLLALDADGQFRETIEMPARWADTSPPQPDVSVRLPLVLAVHNSGARPAEPTRLSLSVPSNFRIANTDGSVLQGRATPGNPLVRYVFEVSPGRVAPDQVPQVLSPLDTLWLEPLIPSYHCTQLDSVPEFVPAPPQDANVLSKVRIFYSFEARTRARQAGVLSVNVEPALLRRPAVPVPPVFPTRTMEPQFPLPVTGPLRNAGMRSARCGDLTSGLEIQSVLWETMQGGRFFVVNLGGKPRKYLFDLNRDSVIELEIWDPDRDGKFEAGRQTRMLIPEFLMPMRAPVAVLAGVSPVDSLTAPTGTDSVAPMAPVTSVPDINFQFPPALFRDTQSGPLRFWREQQNRRNPVRPDSVPEPAVPSDSPRGPTIPRESARAADPESRGRPEPQPSRPRPQPPVPTPSDSGPRLLGRPVGEPPQVRDTMRRDTLRNEF
jgi:hypothetical protein